MLWNFQFNICFIYSYFKLINIFYVFCAVTRLHCSAHIESKRTDFQFEEKYETQWSLNTLFVYYYYLHISWGTVQAGLAQVRKQ